MSKQNDITYAPKKTDPSITGQSTQVRSRCWSVTINNPTKEEIDTWTSASALHWVKEVKGQLEVGVEGTPHIQGLLRTEPIRFAQVKKLFPRAHIEVARSETALARYVVKQESRVAPLSQILVATPQIVQRALVDYVVEYLAPDWRTRGTYYVMIRDIAEDPDNPKKLTLVWRKTTKSFPAQSDTDSTDLTQIINANLSWIGEHSDYIVDSIVAKLIMEGYHSIEFVISNNQVRTAYKKYLPYIIIRCINAPQIHLPPETSETHDEET